VGLRAEVGHGQLLPRVDVGDGHPAAERGRIGDRTLLDLVARSGCGLEEVLCADDGTRCALLDEAPRHEHRHLLGGAVDALAVAVEVADQDDRGEDGCDAAYDQRSAAGGEKLVHELHRWSSYSSRTATQVPNELKLHSCPLPPPLLSAKMYWMKWPTMYPLSGTGSSFGQGLENHPVT